jgi:hypothetical protein
MQWMFSSDIKRKKAQINLPLLPLKRTVQESNISDKIELISLDLNH